MKLHEEFKLYENMWDTKTKPAPMPATIKSVNLKESGTYEIEDRDGETYFTNKGNCYKFFKDIYMEPYGEDLDKFIDAIRKAGCSGIELEVKVDPYEEEQPEYFIKVKDIYKLDPIKIPKNCEFILRYDDEYGFWSRDIVVYDYAMETLLGEAYSLDDIKAFTADIIKTLEDSEEA
jgi:hypothetical protein